MGESALAFALHGDLFCPSRAAKSAPGPRRYAEGRGRAGRLPAAKNNSVPSEPRRCRQRAKWEPTEQRLWQDVEDKEVNRHNGTSDEPP